MNASKVIVIYRLNQSSLFYISKNQVPEQYAQVRKKSWANVHKNVHIDFHENVSINNPINIHMNDECSYIYLYLEADKYALHKCSSKYAFESSYESS